MTQSWSSIVMVCRCQAGEINKSLSQLALVIQRLTSPGSLEAEKRKAMEQKR